MSRSKYIYYPTLSGRDVMLLRWAIAEAATWRGNLVGNLDPEPLRRFDRTVRDCRQVLNEIKLSRRLRKEDK